jgi:hypothetical protein
MVGLAHGRLVGLRRRLPARRWRGDGAAMADVGRALPPCNTGWLHNSDCASAAIYTQSSRPKAPRRHSVGCIAALLSRGEHAPRQATARTPVAHQRYKEASLTSRISIPEQRGSAPPAATGPAGGSALGLMAASQAPAADLYGFALSCPTAQHAAEYRKARALAGVAATHWTKYAGEGRVPKDPEKLKRLCREGAARAVSRPAHCHTLTSNSGFEHCMSQACQRSCAPGCGLRRAAPSSSATGRPPSSGRCRPHWRAPRCPRTWPTRSNWCAPEHLQHASRPPPCAPAHRPPASGRTCRAPRPAIPTWASPRATPRCAAS